MNMSYCRFYNTLQDLKDCYYNIADVENMSFEEKRARKQLIEICMDIADNADYLLNLESEEV
jgi:hypothetical protein